MGLYSSKEEHMVSTHQAGGSNPSRGAFNNILNKIIKYGGVSEWLGRSLQNCSRRFDSGRRFETKLKIR